LSLASALYESMEDLMLRQKRKEVGGISCVGSWWCCPLHNVIFTFGVVWWVACLRTQITKFWKARFELGSHLVASSLQCMTFSGYITIIKICSFCFFSSRTFFRLNLYVFIRLLLLLLLFWDFEDDIFGNCYKPRSCLASQYVSS
jgi:hypothetical protein